MKNLIIVAHPNSDSFTATIAKTVQEIHTQKGYEVRVRNLYALKFNPVLTHEEMGSNNQGKYSADVLAEQEHVKWADLITMVYPIWWTGLPAIVKGYVDRVFLYGFAYQFGANGLEGLLKGKKGLILNPSGMPKDYYDSIGMHNALKLTSDNGIFNFCGITDVKHAFFNSSMNAEKKAIDDHLAEVKAIAESY